MKKILKNTAAILLCLIIALSDQLIYVQAADNIEVEEEQIEGEIDLTEDQLLEEDGIEEVIEEEPFSDALIEETPIVNSAFSLAEDGPQLVATGNCGVLVGKNYSDNLVYELTQETIDGAAVYTLSISGEGEMGPNCDTIWKNLYKELKTGYWKLVLNEGMENIGDYAFYGCTYIIKDTLTIPDSVKTIGSYAFYSCTNLCGDLILPEFLELIGPYAFAGCTGFTPTQLNIPESVLRIGMRAFNNCRFPSYYLPEGLNELDDPTVPETACSYPFPSKIEKTPVDLYVIKNSYAYNWAQDNKQYGYNIELAQKKYRVFYDVACPEGKVEPKITVVYDERPLGELAVPTRDGYTFLGWFTEDNVEITSEDICAGDVYAFAHWGTNTYEVSFDAQGGIGGLDPRNVIFDGTYGALPVVTRLHYSFEGWYTDPEEGTLVTEDSIVKIPNDHTLYAHWLGDPMTLSFDKLDGVGDAEDRVVNYGSKYGTLPVLTKENCIFKGWYTERSGGTLITADSLVDALDDFTIYAHWEGVEMQVYFEANGGVGYLPSITVMYGSTYGPLPTVTRTDKDFGGWFTALEGGTQVTSDTIVNRIGTHNLYAHWDHKHVNVAFNVNGGSSTHEKKLVECEAPYGELPVPERYGYDFDGWYSAKTGGFPIKEDSIVQEITSHTLYAHWTPKAGIKVSFDPTTGTGVTEDIYVIYNSEYSKGGAFPVVTRDSYDFAGWYTAEVGGKQVTPDTLVSVEEDHTLYARWRGRGYTVTFETGETAGKRETKTVYFDDFYGTMPTPGKYGCKFEGWYTEEVEGEKIEPTTRVTLTDNQKLYAHWSNKICEITYELDGGENSPLNPVTYVKSTNTIKLYDPYKLGYKFNGWYVSPKKLAKEKITQISKGMAEDLTLYAKWTANTYKITYVMGLSATNPNSKKTSYRVPDHLGDMKYEFKAPSKKGYVFEGWFLDQAFTQPIRYIDGTFEGNIKVYAKWSGATYFLRYHADDAVAGEENITEHQYKDTSCTVSDGSGFIKEGYHVYKWYLNENLKGTNILAGSNKNDIITEDGEIVDVYASWTPNKYYVAFDGNGATSGKTNDRKFTFGEYNEIRTCSYKKTGYVFDHWNSEPDDSGKNYYPKKNVKNLTTYNEDTVILYAQWKPITYTLEFAPGGGTGKMSKIKVTYDEATTLPDNLFTKANYEFKNWQCTSRINKVYPTLDDGETAVLNLGTSAGCTRKLKAMWQYHIEFDPDCDDATGSMDSIVVDAYTSYRLPECTYVREGYTFKGWALKPGQKSYKYGNKSKIYNVGNATLYAVWKAK